MSEFKLSGGNDGDGITSQAALSLIRWRIQSWCKTPAIFESFIRKYSQDVCFWSFWSPNDD
jgi:hypothetical protein